MATVKFYTATQEEYNEAMKETNARIAELKEKYSIPEHEHIKVTLLMAFNNIPDIYQILRADRGEVIYMNNDYDVMSWDVNTKEITLVEKF